MNSTYEFNKSDQKWRWKTFED